MSEQYNRLENIAVKYFNNLSQLSIKLGKKKGFFSGYKKQKGIGDNILKELRDKLGINPEYIVFGREPMLLDVEYNNSTVNNNTMRISEPKPEYNGSLNKLPNEFIEGMAMLKLYDIPVHAYEGNVMHDFSQFPFSWKPLLLGYKLDPKCHFAFVVSGFSMDDARIYDGDTIIVDSCTTLETVKNNDLVVCSLNGIFMVKKIIKNDINIFELHSEHNGMPAIVVNHIDDVFKVFGKVVATINFRS